MSQLVNGIVCAFVTEKPEQHESRSEQPSGRKQGGRFKGGGIADKELWIPHRDPLSACLYAED